MIKNKIFLSLISILLFISLFSSLAKAQSADSLYSLKFGEIAMGLDYRFSNGLNTTPNQKYTTILYGVSVKMQSSLIAHQLYKKPTKWMFSDILNAEIGTGIYSSNSAGVKSDLAFYYNFDFGLAIKHQLNRNHDLAIHFILLKFGIDKVSPNISGSMLMLKYRAKKWIFSTGITARRDRIFGWIKLLDSQNSIPMLYHIRLQYLMKKNTQLYLSTDWMNSRNSSYFDFNMKPNYQLYFSLGYGKCF